MATPVINHIAAAASSGAEEVLIQPFDFNQAHENELVFFFKPGCFQVNEPRNIEAIVDMALTKLQTYRVAISGVLLLSGKRLEELEIMDRHYGYINTLSKQASNILHQEDREHIYQELGITSHFERYVVLGGHEFLQRFPTYDHRSLHEMWISKHSHKLRSGFYIQQYDVDGQQVILVNGFHPSQLAVFTNPAHKIVVMLVHADTDWHALKYDLVGDTFPERAKPDSIRGELFAHHERYGVRDVTVSNNMVHLSAGPFEALFELYNFFHALPAANFALPSTNMARRMISAGASAQDVQRCLTNPKTSINGHETDLFTATEDMDSTRALEEYAHHITVQ